MTLHFCNFKGPITGTYFLYHDVVEGNVVPAHTHDFYEIFVVMGGRIDHWVNGSIQRLTPGDLVFVRAGDCHYYQKSDGGKVLNVAFTAQVLEGMKLLFNESRFEALLGGDRPPVVHSGGDPVELDARIRQISALDSNGTGWEFALKQLIVWFFCRIFDRTEDTRTIPRWLTDLQKQMEKPENFIAGTSRFFELSGRSPEHVSRQLRRYLHQSPTGYVNCLRLNYAKNRLLITNDSIQDICYDAGFNNLNYFYALFKRFVQMTPLQYRQRFKSEFL